MAVLPLGTVATPFVSTIAPVAGVPGITGTGGATSATAATAPGFGDMLASGIRSVADTQQQADVLAGQLATGTATDIADVTTAAAKASLGVSLTAAVRNRAVEAYQEIMRMQV